MAEKKETAPESLNIYQRIHAVMGEVDYVQKERKQGMQYTIVSHDAVTALVRPKLHAHGVVYHPVEMVRSQDGNRTQIDFAIAFVNIDNPEDRIIVPTCGYGIDSQDKGVGKAISYGVKYALLKLLGLETGDDPDNDQHTQHKPDAKTDIKPQRATPARNGTANGKAEPTTAQLAAAVQEWADIREKENIKTAVLAVADAAGVNVNGKATVAQVRQMLNWVAERRSAGVSFEEATSK